MLMGIMMEKGISSTFECDHSDLVCIHECTIFEKNVKVITRMHYHL